MPEPFPGGPEPDWDEEFLSGREDAPEEQQLVTSGPGQNVDRTVAFIAGMHGLPVPEDLIRKPEEEDKTGWHEVDGEWYPPEYFG